MKKIFFIIINIIFLSLIGCSPITPLTRAKKTPKIYTQNFCCEEKVKKSLEKRTPWIVYSDRDENPSYYNAGGKVVLKKASYMESFLVIGKKGTYLRLVKYDPNIIENNSLKNRKQIVYYGWVHRDNLLLSSHAITDINSGRSYKMIATMKNDKALIDTELLFSKDSLILYKEPELLNPIKKIALHSLVYLYKKNDDRRKSLVFVKTKINPENAKEVISGWTSSSLIAPYGNLFYSQLSQIPLQKLTIIDASKKAITQEPTSIFQSEGDFMELNPITSTKQEGNVVALDTYAPINAIDNNENYVYGLSGNPITYKQFKKLKDNLKHINIVFAFENHPNVKSNFEQLVISINQFKNQLPRKGNVIYRIGAVIGFGMDNNTLLEISLSKDLDTTLKELDKLADIKNQISDSKEGSWKATLKASQILTKYKDENNIIVSIGESGNNNEKVEDPLIQSITNVQARVLGYQVYADTGNSFNNFVLQIQDIILRTAKEIATKKKDFLVNSNQLRAENLFVEKGDNQYSLDFPGQSMWQGWVIFPKKKEFMSQDLLVSSLTSLVQEVQSDSKNITDELQKSFAASGMPRSKISSQWASLQNLPNEYTTNANFAKTFAGAEPHTLFPALVEIKETDWEKGNRFLLLSEDEIEVVHNFLSDITQKQVDYKYNAKKDIKHKKSFLEDDGDTIKEKTQETPEYDNTRKVRRSVQRSYYKWVRNNKLHPLKKWQIKKISLSKATELCIWMPSSNTITKKFTVIDVGDRKTVSDAQLDKLITYFLHKKETFDKAINEENQLKSNGEIFYKISREYLP